MTPATASPGLGATVYRRFRAENRLETAAATRFRRN